MQIVETVATQPHWLYHVTTSSHLGSIQRHGLVPMAGHDSGTYGEPQRAVYLSATPENCYDMLDWLLDRHGGEPILLAVAFKHLDQRALQPDDYDLRIFLPGGELPDARLAGFQHWQDVPWQLSLAVCGAVAYTKVIPPAAFRQIN
jgi:hypothetical protein